MEAKTRRIEMRIVLDVTGEHAGVSMGDARQMVIDTLNFGLGGSSYVDLVEVKQTGYVVGGWDGLRDRDPYHVAT